MNLDCEEIQGLIQSFSLVRKCDSVRSGAVRLSTPFRYPDGSYIDVFLVKSKDLWPEFYLTDYGQTVGQLLDVCVPPTATKKRRQFVDDVCATLEVEHVGGEFRIGFASAELGRLPDLIVRLSQACVRVSDLALTQRFRNVTGFKDDLEEFVAGAQVSYESDIDLEGKFGKLVHVDFLVTGAHSSSAVQTLSTTNSSAAHGLSNEVFRRWYDLAPQRSKHNFVTIYDTTSDAFRTEDLDRIRDLSMLLGFPAESEDIQAVLAA